MMEREYIKKHARQIVQSTDKTYIKANPIFN